MDPERKWIDFVGEDPDFSIIYEKTERQSEHNPSLFKSDVKEYCKYNSHHLGKDPSTYARTVQRMPRMKKLIEAIYRVNKQPKAFVNHEALRFVWDRESKATESDDAAAVLGKAGVGLSYQRIEIYKFISENTDASVEQVFVALRLHIPSLSKTTVYNTIKAFNKAGISWK